MCVKRPGELASPSLVVLDLCLERNPNYVTAMTPPFVLFAISVFTAAALQTLAGFGFAMIVMPLAVLVFGLEVAAPLVAVIALTLYVTNLARYRRALDFREVGRLGVFAIVWV